LTVHERLTYLLRQVMLHAATAEELTELSDLVKADHTGEHSQYIAAQLQADLLQSAPVQDASYWDGLADQILAADHPDRVKVHRMPAGRHLRRIFKTRWTQRYTQLCIGGIPGGMCPPCGKGNIPACQE
jgi:hypothetical protein